MHTRPRGLHATREQIQIGAEIYGHAGLEADLEIQQLMLDALHLAGLSRIRLDLGHAGVLAALLARDAQAPSAASRCTTRCRADVPLLNEPPTISVPIRAPRCAAAISMATQACSPRHTLAGAARNHAGARRSGAARGTGERCRSGDRSRRPARLCISQRCDVQRLHRRRAERDRAGGRYDHVGQAAARPSATGFSLDLRELARISPVEARGTAILAPWAQDDALSAAVAALRDAGEVVIQALPGHDHVLDEFACDRSLVERNGAWGRTPINRRSRDVLRHAYR